MITKNWVMLNCTNWDPAGLANLPIADCSELTYFVLPVGSNGALLGMDATKEQKFVNDVHAGGKKATFSIAGGAQNASDVKTAVTINRTSFINNIYNHMVLHGYDGVTVDIENTSIDPQAMVDFLNALRAKLGPSAILGCYVQPYQADTVWAKVEQAKNALSWISVMLYDYPNTVEQIVGTNVYWVNKVGKEKVLLGAATNYDTTGFDINEWPRALDIVVQQGWGGVGIWESRTFTEPYRAVLRQKFASITPPVPPPANDTALILSKIEDLRKAYDSRDKMEAVEAIVWGPGTLSERMNRIKLLVPNE